MKNIKSKELIEDKMSKKIDDFIQDVTQKKYKMLDDFAKAYLSAQDLDVKTLKSLIKNNKIKLIQKQTGIGMSANMEFYFEIED